MVLAPAQALAEIVASYSGCPCTAGTWPNLVFSFTNNLPYTTQLMGFRFDTPSVNSYSCTGGPAATVSGSGPYQYEQDLSQYDQVRAIGSTLNTYSCYTAVGAGKDGTPNNLQLLVKTGSCNPIPPVATPTPVTCAQVAAIAAQPSYYSGTCVPHGLGNLGGPYSGGFINTFEGQTQIQQGEPTVPWSDNGTNCLWEPGSMGGPLYMMAAAMSQEYLSIDMDFLLGDGAKESFAGMVQVPGSSVYIPTNSVGVNGTYNIEDTTGLMVIMSYPSFFPRHACVSAAPNVTTALAYPCVTADGGQVGVGNWYMCTGGYPCPYQLDNSAQLVDSVFSSGLFFWWFYDAMDAATNLCFRTFLSNTQDPLSVIKILPGAYNEGYNSVFDTVLTMQPASWSLTDITPDVEAGNSNYEQDVLANVSNISAANSCSGQTIYDTPILLSDLQTFFFGNGGTAAVPGNGGLWSHFSNLYSSAAARGQLWTDVTCAFDTLAPHWAAEGGAAHIHYRYDFLTILRVARQYLTLARPVPTESDFNQFVTANSTDATACGTTVDTSFPVLVITAPSTLSATAQCPGFTVTFTGTDNQAVATAQWTTDPTWQTWNAASGAGPAYSFTVPGSAANYPAPGSTGQLWVNVTDSCGNSTVQELSWVNQCGTPTPTATGTSTSTDSPSATPSASPSATRTASPSASPSVSPSGSPSPSPSASATSSASPTASGTPSPSPSASASPTLSLSPSPTGSPSASATLSASPSPSPTASPSPSPSATGTPSATAAPTPNGTFTATPSASPSATASSSFTPSPSATASPSATPTATQTASFTSSTTLSATPSASPSATRTCSATPSGTASVSPTLSPTSTPSPSATASPSDTPSATVTASFSATRSRTASPTVSVTWTISPTFTVSPTASPSANGFAQQPSLVSEKSLFPNPFQSQLNVYVSVRVEAYATLSIFNIAGEPVRKIKQECQAGANSVVWDGNNDFGARCASGIYILHFAAQGVDGSQGAFWDRAAALR